MRVRLGVLLLFLVGTTLYANSIFNSFLGDDYLQIIDNKNVHSITNITSFFTGSTYESGGTDKVTGIFYRPLMLTFFAMLYSFFGPNPAVFHLIQLLIHTINSILVFFFLIPFFKQKGAFILALLFLIHPIQNEVVVYSANLQEVLFFFFGMSAMLLVQQRRHLDTRKHIILFLLLLFSFFAKESGILFISSVMLYGLLFKKKDVKRLALTTAFVLLIYLFFRYGIANMHLAGHSISPLANAPLHIRFLSMPAVLFYYIKQFLLPVSISSNHFWMVREFTLTSFYLPILGVTVAIVGLIRGYIFVSKKNKNMAKTYIFFALWFGMGMVLHSQLIPLDATVADRWFYYTLVGASGCIALFFQQLSVSNTTFKKAYFIAIAIVFILLSIRNFVRTQDWTDGERLYSRDIKNTPKNFILDNAYATELITAEKFQEAKPYVLSSVSEYPYYANLTNLGIVYASEEDYINAKKYLYQATQNSTNYVVYENYASFLQVYGDLSEAQEFTKHALLYFPKNGKLFLTQAKNLYLLGDKTQALAAASKAHELLQSKESAVTLNNLKNNVPLAIKRNKRL